MPLGTKKLREGSVGFRGETLDVSNFSSIAGSESRELLFHKFMFAQGLMTKNFIPFFFLP